MQNITCHCPYTAERLQRLQANDICSLSTRQLLLQHNTAEQVVQCITTLEIISSLDERGTCINGTSDA
jgi:hypothetical protein